MPAAPRLAPTRDGETWDRLVGSLPGGTAFHRWSHLDLAERLLGIRVERLIVEVGGEPVGVWPVPLSSRWATVSPPFPYLGPLVPEEALLGAVGAFRRRQARTALVAADFDLPPGALAPSGALRRAGLTVLEDATVTVALPATEEQLLAGYSTMRRRSVKRARAAGSSARLARPGELTALLKPVLDEAYGARGVASPYPDDAGAVIEDWAAEHPEVQVLTALVGDEPAGVLVVLTGDDVALSWVGGCLRRYRDAGPNVVLHHEQLLLAMAAGARSVDLVGTVDDGIREFKLAFGGELLPYVRLRSRLGPSAAWALVRRVRRSAGQRDPAAV